MDENEPKLDERADANVFETLLARKDAVHTEVFTFPFFEEAIIIYYRLLESGEEPVAQFPDDFATLSNAERIRLQLDHTSQRVFRMIDKARNDAPEKYRLSRQQWDALKRDLPDVHDKIVLTISGVGQAVAKAFFGGPRTPARASSS